MSHVSKPKSDYRTVQESGTESALRMGERGVYDEVFRFFCVDDCMVGRNPIGLGYERLSQRSASCLDCASFDRVRSTYSNRYCRPVGDQIASQRQGATSPLV